MCKTIPIILLYLLTVPTNMMCLGAFTESWLQDFSISRQTLTYIYFFSTFFVYFGLKWLPKTYSARTLWQWIGAVFFGTVMGAKHLPFCIIIGLSFFLLQYLGQGMGVQICRICLLKESPSICYSQAVGWMEALGSFAVFLCPFFLLQMLQHWSWSSVFFILALLYIGISFFLSQNKIPILSNSDMVQLPHGFGFWAINVMVYLPVFTCSGLFFHLEGFCKSHGIEIATLSLYTTFQMLGSIGSQILLGYGVQNRWYWLKWICVLQILLQGFWLLSLFHFHTWGKWVYTIAGALSWGCFGLLINVIWPYLYGNKTPKTIFCLQESVRFGFLANALGPCLFYLLL